MKRIGLALALTLISCTAFAAVLSSALSQQDPQRYQIEVIVIQHTTPAAFHSSEWQNAKDIDVATLDINTYPLLDNDDFKMNKEEETLTKDSNYRILKHISWTQSLEELADPKQVQLNNSNPTDGWQLSGAIKVSLRHYFRINIDLRIKQNFSHAFIFRDYKTFRLTQSRKMKSSELNYIDSPVLGVLVKIVPDTTKPEIPLNIDLIL